MKIKKGTTKERIINSLDGKIEVISVRREDEISIVCEFIKNGKTGTFGYTLEETKRGIEWVGGYHEEDGEDIYEDIHEWIDENIEWGTTIKCQGKKLDEN